MGGEEEGVSESDRERGDELRHFNLNLGLSVGVVRLKNKYCTRVPPGYGTYLVGATANFDLWGVAEKRRKKKKEKKEKERKKKVFTLKIRFQNYTFF